MFCLGLLICLQKLHGVLLNTKASSGRYCWLRNVFWGISVILLTTDESAEAGGSQLQPDIWSVSLASLMNSCRLVLCYRGKKVHSWKWVSSSLPLPQTPHDASCVQIMCTRLEKKQAIIPAGAGQAVCKKVPCPVQCNFRFWSVCHYFRN